ncbi:ice-binding family protein [Spirosoma foliorum]|uniref:DUF3494 domain-containing protein n=1 Tax=Spirosoma foliorum TaxID=2710596 RepID=A0A7G5H4M2_9BACT|nr:ice-binding family protein [Spirosoma foliorum]QMW06064.1 DUF3494 domain-containing protein [Spirosoma foliorum]
MTKLLSLAVLYVTLFSLSAISFGQAPNLGTASSFALFTANGAFSNTGASMVVGDIGTNAGAFGGFPSPGTVVGNIRLPASAEAAQAALDVVAAYNSLNTVVCNTTIIAELASQTLTPGVSCQPLTTANSLNGTLTLSGTGIYIIKLNGALTTATNSSILLTNGATADNVYFQVNGAVTLGTGSSFIGTILALDAVVLGTQASLEGRALSTAGAITLNNNRVNAATLAPDLTPTIELSQANFALAPDNERNFAVNVFELAGNPTSSGNVAMTITVPIGYTISFTNTLSTILISGGSTEPVAVDNTHWTVTNTDGRQISLIINAGQFIAAKATARLGFTMTRTTANSGSISSITVNVTNDASHSYDSNPFNNIYARIVSGL